MVGTADKERFRTGSAIPRTRSADSGPGPPEDYVFARVFSNISYTNTIVHLKIGTFPRSVKNGVRSIFSPRKNRPDTIFYLLDVHTNYCMSL